MYCRHCGQSIPSDSKFCPGCGQSVEKAAAPASSPASARPSAPSTPAAPAQAKKSNPLFTLLFWACVFFLGYMAFSYISNNYGPSKATENTASASLNPQYTALLQRYHVADSDSKNACYAIDLGNVLQVVMLQASGDRLNGIVIKHYTQHTGAKLDPKAVDDYLKDYFKPVIDAGCANVLPSINRTNYIESEVSIYSLNHPENVRALEKVGLVQPPIPEQISAGEFGSALMAGGYIPRTK